MWLLHCGRKREEVAEILEVATSTVQRDVAAYRIGGLEALLKSGRNDKPTSALAQYTDQIRESLEREPARTIAEACQRIADLTGVERKPTQVALFLKGMGLKWQRVRAIPVPPKNLTEHAADQSTFHDNTLKPALDAAQAGNGHVFFVDTAHFVYGTFLCCLWSFTRLFVRAAAGRGSGSMCSVRGTR